MGKIKELLHGSKNPLQGQAKPLKIIDSKSSVDGKIPHSHSIKRDSVGRPISVGPPDKGPNHTHPIIDLDPGYKLGPAGDSDPGDPKHIHSIPNQSEGVHKKKKKKLKSMGR